MARKLPCVVKWVGRKGLRVKALTYCNETIGDGVNQVPNNAQTCEKCSSVLWTLMNR